MMSIHWASHTPSNLNPLIEAEKAMPPPLQRRRSSTDDSSISQISRLPGHRRSSSLSKSLYQLARPARHAHHPFHQMRPRLLMQLQQISHTGRPLLLLDVFPSTAFMPFLVRGLALYFGRWSGLNPNDVTIIQNTLCEIPKSTMDTNLANAKEDGRSRNGIVARICQPLRKDVRLQAKTKIYLSMGSSCEAICLPDGSYEFIQQGINGIKTMRWALRHKKPRPVSHNSYLGDVSRLFTFSIIAPGTRRHAVIATMTRDWMEVSTYYCPVDSAKPCKDVDERLRELILVTGIWVALRQGWT